MENEFKLRDYQQEISQKGSVILKEKKILILNMEVRTGKTHVALNIASDYQRVLFVTTKKAISSIEDDYSVAGHSFELVVINYESLHKVTGMFDLIICDESHKLGAYPKPSVRVKLLKSMVKNDLILLTGTLMPESHSQIFHQLWISPFSPYSEHKNFYKWFGVYGNKKQIRTPYGLKPDYSDVCFKYAQNAIDDIKISFTQSQAGFSSEVKENIIWNELPQSTMNVISMLKKDKIVEGSNGEVILADTAVKLMSKLHQLYSGTVKLEDETSLVIDNSKAVLIKSRFNDSKIVIFYKFKAELSAIKSVYGDDITTDLQEFNETPKSIALQIVSGREGINLSKADSLVYYNIDFSAVSYWQSRDRLTTKERSSNNVYWIFSRGGIETKVYASVMDKKKYTLSTFKDDRTNFAD